MDGRRCFSNVATFRPPRVLVARHCMGRAECSVPRVCVMQRKPRGVSEPGPPLLRADVRSSQERSLQVEGLNSRRTGALNPAVERRKASVPEAQMDRKFRLRGTQGAPNGSAATRDLCACGPTILARKRVPPHPKRLSALRSLTLCGRKSAKLGGYFLARTARLGQLRY